MALSNLEGCTIGGLDEGRGHNTRILAMNAKITFTDVSDGAGILSVDMDGTVTNTVTGDAMALTVGFGHGYTLEVPTFASADFGNTFQLTFGVAQTTAPTPSSEQFEIKVAHVTATFIDGSANLALPVGVHDISGNQIQFTIGDATNEATTNLAVADGDDIVLNVIAYAQPAN
jgi:hypothetical protein